MSIINRLHVVNDDIDPDKNFCRMNYRNVDYYMPDKFNEFINCKNIGDNFSLLHLNARSLENKLDDLHAFLNSLTMKFTVVVVTETWANESNMQRLVIPGYSCYMKPRIGRRGGGVAVYVEESISCVVKDEMNDCESDNFEFLCVQLNLPFGNKANIAAVYRPPNTDLRRFVTDCSKLLEKLVNKKDTSYVVGDFNVNLINYETHAETSDFLNMALEHYLYPTITKPTRFSKSTSTLIDNIFVSNLNEDYNAGLFISDFSDHLPIFYISSTKLNSRKNHEIIYSTHRVISNTAINHFQSKLSEVQWTIDTASNDPNVSYNHFLSKFDALYNESFPSKSTKMKVYKNLSKPWITSGLLKSTKEKDKLY